MNIKHLLLTLTGIAIFASAKAQVTYTTTPKGASYHIFTNNAGPKIKTGDVITFNAIQKTDKDSVLFSTYKTGTPVKLQVQPSQNIGDLMDIFPLLAEKDSAEVKVPTDSIFVGHEDQRPPFLAKGSSIIFVLKIIKIQSLAQAMAERDSVMAKMKAEAQKLKGAEIATMKQYITDKKLAVKTTPSGLNYIITTPTLKRKPLNGDTVYVNYVGHTLEGKVFDSSIESVAKEAGLNQPGRAYEPISVVLGEHRVITGWEEGLLLLNEGSKATFVIPSALAYGDRAAGPDIKPYSTLVFDLELVKVKPGKHVAAKPTAKKTTTAKKATTAAKKPAAKKAPVKK